MDISVSSDGVQFTKLMSYQTPGDTTGYVDVELGGQQARTLRITCNGNNDPVNSKLVKWNNFQEIEVWGKPA